MAAVFFDLYETLITEWHNGERKAEHKWSGDSLEYAIFKREWSARRRKRMDGSFPNCRSCVDDIMNRQGVKVDEQVEEEIKAFIRGRLRAKAVPFQHIDNTILNMLQELKSNGLKIGLISNCAPEEVHAWGDCPLRSLFDDVIFSYGVQCAKPDPSIYRMAMSNLGVSAEQSVFIGDGGSDELHGAAKVGIHAYHATWFQPLWLSEQQTTFPKLTHPDDVIRRIIDNA